MDNHTKKPIIIGSDNAAYPLKEILKNYLKKKHIEVFDIGTESTKSVNYAIYGKKLAEAVSSGKFKKGILLCGTGIGMSITANRFKGVRATLCNDVFSAKMSKQHNNSNVLVLGGRIIGDVLAKAILDVWLETEFEGGRHQERLDVIDN